MIDWVRSKNPPREFFGPIPVVGNNRTSFEEQLDRKKRIAELRLGNVRMGPL
jgi:hypothetical protein